MQCILCAFSGINNQCRAKCIYLPGILIYTILEMSLIPCDGKTLGGGKEKPEISRKERLQQLLTKHDMRMRAESSFTYVDISRRIFQR